jgi:hypothetical protein
MTAEPLVHWPGLACIGVDVLLAAVCFTPAFICSWLYGVYLGLPSWLLSRVIPRFMMQAAPGAFLEFTLYLVAIDSTRRDLHPFVMAAYAGWIFFGKKIPWDKMKKKLGSTISSLTEVARAALQRQQSEAFS